MDRQARQELACSNTWAPACLAAEALVESASQAWVGCPQGTTGTEVGAECWTIPQHPGGLHVYLHPFCLRALVAAAGGHANLPQTIRSRAVSAEIGPMTPELSKRCPYLAHVPTGTWLCLVELDLRHLVPDSVLTKTTVYSTMTKRWYALKRTNKKKRGASSKQQPRYTAADFEPPSAPAAAAEPSPMPILGKKVQHQGTQSSVWSARSAALAGGAALPKLGAVEQPTNRAHKGGRKNGRKKLTRL